MNRVMGQTKLLPRHLPFAIRSNDLADAERWIARLEPYSCSIDPHACLTILLDSPRGWVLNELSAGADWSQTVVITDNRCPEYLLDLWDQKPLTLLIDDGNLLPELVNILAHGPQRIPSAIRCLRSMLGPGERAVLRLIARGKTDKQIADVLGYAERTVMNKSTNILRVLGLANRTQAALYYMGLWHMIDGFQIIDVKESNSTLERANWRC